LGFGWFALGAALTLQEPAREASPPSAPAPACLSVSKRDVPQPRKLHDAHPDWAELTKFAAPPGPLIYHATIGPGGTVTLVKAVHLRARRRADPKLESLYADAIRKWTFEPTRVDGKPVPVCMTVTVMIDPQ
jgi:hypothetical protein